MIVEGFGLHSGHPSRVVFERKSGPTAIATREAEVSLDDLVVVDATRSTTIGAPDGQLRVATVEHLFAAMAGLSVREGVRCIVEGPEIPLADGGARSFVEALAALALPKIGPSLRIEKIGTIAIGSSVYTFAPGDDVSVEVTFEDPKFGATASWHGDASDFVERIAPARTFGFAREVEELLDRGLAKHVAPESVVVLSESGALFAGLPFSPDEPARHKLLDLIGDLFVHGGPPRGTVRALRPGHASTHAALAQAMADGIVSSVVGDPSIHR